MDANLKAKCDLLADNYKITQNAAKLDFSQAAGLGALIYTNMNIRADESVIRSNRKILKHKVGALSNLRGHTNIALLCKMSLKRDPEAYLDNVVSAYKLLNYGVFRSEYEALAAASIVDFVDPSQYQAIAQKTGQILTEMSRNHPMLTGHEDVAVAALFAMSDLDVEAKLAEAEACYENLRHDHFTFAKDALLSVCMILALSEKPIEEKCERFRQLRNAVNSTDIYMFAGQLPMLAAMVDTDATVDQVARDINEASHYLKGKSGFGSILGMGSSMRNVLASAMALQVYQEDAKASAATATAGNVAAGAIAQQIVLAIVMTIIIIAVVSSSNSSSHS